MKKLVSLILFLLILLLIFIFNIYNPRSYAYQYKISGFKVVEKYYKYDNHYSFIIKDDNNKYVYSTNEKYHRQRGLIKTITSDDNCIFVSTIKINSFVICKNDEEYVTKFYDQEIAERVIENFENITIYNKMNKKFLIWNYDSFAYITDNKNKSIKLFDNDVYELEIITKLDRYLVVADYSQKYYFNRFLIVDSKNGSIKKAKLNRKIYFDSYILGTYKKNLYLYDNNSEVEYVINPFKKVINKNKYEVLIDGKWEKVSLNKLKKQEVSFINNEKYFFKIIDNQLYYITPVSKTLVANLEVSRIIESDNQVAYFISGDSLFFVDMKDGITKLMSYSEWQFNNSNIYIF